MREERAPTSAARVAQALFGLWIGWVVGSSPVEATEPARDLPEVLEEVGLTLEDLALGAAADWLGTPAPETLPYLLPHWSEASRDPRRLIALAGNLQHTSRYFARSRRLRPRGEVDPELTSLRPLVTTFALQPRLPGFRGLPVVLWQIPGQDGALTAVLAGIRRAPTGEKADVVDHRRSLRPMPPSKDELSLPQPLRAPVARLLGSIWQAAEAVDRSWRRVPRRVVRSAVETRDVPRLLAGGSRWWPAIDDAAHLGDDVERAAAFLTVVSGLERAAEELSSIEDRSKLAGFDRWTVETPWGRVIVAGTGTHRHVCSGDCLAIVDLGGDDQYVGSAAVARGLSRPVSVVLDLAGNDRYQATQSAAQGVGLGGVGVLFDLSGDDHYQAEDRAQGFGLLGYGLLWDADGNDRYQADGGAQGAAVFGAGLLVDATGRDTYSLLGEGQGFGGTAACGALIDLFGDDHYIAEPDASAHPERADSHADGLVAANNAQGVGVGRRGDATDGHVWAGGLGVLSDLAGNDSYSAGLYAQGAGYWFGTGLLLDSAGDDVYRSVYFSQAAGIHFSLALLWDASGNDRHLLDQRAAASLGYGWDFAVSAFIDGGGDDIYRAEDTALGVAERSSIALFLELGGNDEYRLPGNARNLGGVPKNPEAWLAGGPVRAPGVAPQVGLFVDLGGQDLYPAASDAPPRREAKRSCRGQPGNLKSWSCSPDGLPQLGAGIDLEQPSPPDLMVWLGSVVASRRR